MPPDGRLPVTYDDFERYGIHRHAIAPAIRETVALGFAEITERGRAGNAEFRSPHKFRLTYLRVGRAPTTNEWQRIKTVEEAQARAKAARREVGQKTKVQWRKKPNLSGENRHRKRRFHSAETSTTTRLSADSTTTSISRGEGDADRPAREGNANPPAVLCSDVGMSFWAGTRVGGDDERISAKISRGSANPSRKIARAICAEVKKRAGKDRAKQKAFKDASERLIDLGYVGRWDDQVWLAKE